METEKDKGILRERKYEIHDEDRNISFFLYLDENDELVELTKKDYN